MAIANGLNPNVREISFSNGTAVITGGNSVTADTIFAEVGGTARISPGSIYISSGSGVATNVIWVLLPAAWKALTIN